MSSSAIPEFQDSTCSVPVEGESLSNYLPTSASIYGVWTSMSGQVREVLGRASSHLGGFYGATAGAYAIGTFCLVKTGSSAQKAWRAWKGVYNKEEDASTRMALLETGKTVGYGVMAGVGFAAPVYIFPHIPILN